MKVLVTLATLSDDVLAYLDKTMSRLQSDCGQVLAHACSMEKTVRAEQTDSAVELRVVYVHLPLEDAQEREVLADFLGMLVTRAREDRQREIEGALWGLVMSVEEACKAARVPGLITRGAWPGKPTTVFND